MLHHTLPRSIVFGSSQQNVQPGIVAHLFELYNNYSVYYTHLNIETKALEKKGERRGCVNMRDFEKIK